MSWIDTQIQLQNEQISLIPLDQSHFSDLLALAEDSRIWEFIPIDMSTPEKRIRVWQQALIEKETRKQLPFVIWHRAEQKIIGSTRLMNIEPAHRKLEIGWTWLHPDYWIGSINLTCKQLLLRYCFDELKAIRVQLKTDENNHRSRKAIAKLGAQYEGILRNDWIRDNGIIRNSVYFSIIDTEWASCQQHIQQQITQSF